MAERREYARDFGFGEAAKQAHFIAAPLLTAAALSLAGVVGGADDRFRWPGVTLLLLVATSMTLIASIQMGYYALQFKFSKQELIDRQEARGWPLPSAEETQRILRDSNIAYESKVRHASTVFNIGTLMLGFGIAAALVPPDCGEQAGWRIAAAILVLMCTLIEIVWVLKVLMK